MCRLEQRGPRVEQPQVLAPHVEDVLETAKEPRRRVFGREDFDAQERRSDADVLPQIVVENDDVRMRMRVGKPTCYCEGTRESRRRATAKTNTGILASPE